MHMVPVGPTTGGSPAIGILSPNTGQISPTVGRLSRRLAGFRQQSAESRQQSFHFRRISAKFRQQSVNLRGRSVDFRQQSTDFRRTSAKFRQQSVDFRRHLADFRQQSADFRRPPSTFGPSNVHQSAMWYTKCQGDLESAHRARFQTTFDVCFIQKDLKYSVQCAVSYISRPLPPHCYPRLPRRYRWILHPSRRKQDNQHSSLLPNYPASRFIVNKKAS